MRRIKNWFILSIIVLLSALLTPHTSHAQEFPNLYEAYPRKGGQGEEIHLLLRGDGFERIKNLDLVIFREVVIDLRDFQVLSNELIEVQLVIPPQTPVGTDELRFIFDDIPYDAFFEVTPGAEEGLPALGAQFRPQEGQRDAEMTLFVALDYPFATDLTRGAGFDLGEFIDLIIGDMEVTVNAIKVNEAGNLLVFQIYLPPETPIGETQVRLYYENHSFRDDFLVIGPGVDQNPEVYGYRPRSGNVDSEIEFILEGNYLFGMGEMIGVQIAGLEVPVLYAGIESDQMAFVGAHLPAELPAGQHGMVFFYENYAYETEFLVQRGEERPGQVELWGLSPQEGRPDSSLDLYLEGANLYALGELIFVRIGGVDLEGMEVEIESDDSAVIYTYLPEDTPIGEQQITVAFQNARIAEAFEVRRGLDPLILILIIGGGGAAVAVAVLVLRPKPPKDKTEKTQKKPLTDYEIRFEIGPESQTVDSDRASLILDLDLRFEVQADPGEQEIRANGDKLIEDN